MSIRSIDLQVLLGKTLDVEKGHQIQQQASLITQNQIVTSSLKEKEIQEKQVLKSPQKEGIKIEDNRQQRYSTNDKKRKKTDKDDKNLKINDNNIIFTEGNFVDLKI